ncbi:MAG TPA: amidohydrolase family protein, partial [Steroidobacter sp.]|nr:amidohydrolase family protein [Steroidobacter sp.]
MSSRQLFRPALVLLGGMGFVAGAAAQESADLLMVGGKVLTVDRDFSIASAVAVKDGKILAVGGDDLARKYTAKRTVDLKGRVLMPGFTDTHIHIRTSAQRDVDLIGVKSIAQLQELVRKKAKELGPGKWITGYGWDEAIFAEKRNPSRADLDAAAPDNPVALTRAGGHSIVGNSAAIKIAGITPQTPDPPSGLIEKDAKGQLNGVIRESNEMYLKHAPPNQWEDLSASYVESLKSLLALGITSVMDASGSIDDEPVGKG